MNIFIKKGIAAILVFLMMVLVFLYFQRAGEHLYSSPALFFDRDCDFTVLLLLKRERTV